LLLEKSQILLKCHN